MLPRREKGGRKLIEMIRIILQFNFFFFFISKKGRKLRNDGSRIFVRLRFKGFFNQGAFFLMTKPIPCVAVCFRNHSCLQAILYLKIKLKKKKKKNLL